MECVVIGMAEARTLALTELLYISVGKKTGPILYRPDQNLTDHVWTGPVSFVPWPDRPHSVQNRLGKKRDRSRSDRPDSEPVRFFDNTNECCLNSTVMPGMPNVQT